MSTTPLKGNINHSVCRWCYQDIPLEQLCVATKGIGIKGIDLVGQANHRRVALQKHGLDSPMCNGAELSLTDGFNDPKFHATLLKSYAAMIGRVKSLVQKSHLALQRLLRRSFPILS